MKRAAVQLLAAGLLPIPAISKRPKYSHKPLPASASGASGPRWTREIAEREIHLFDDCTEIGILVTNNLMVIDFDTVEIYNEWHAAFKELFDATALVETKHGYHVYLKRSAYCNEKRLHDGPIGFFVNPKTQKKEKKPVDIKTISASTSPVMDAQGVLTMYHTPGFVSTPPSMGKTWVRSVFDTPLAAITDALVDRILLERGNSCTATARGVASVSCAGANTTVMRALNDASNVASVWKGHDTIPSTAEGRSGGSKAVASEGATASEEAAASDAVDACAWKPCFANDQPCLQEMGFTRVDNLTTFHNCNAKSREKGYTGGGYQFTYRGKCPCCGKDDGHDHNMFFVMYKSNGDRRILNYSANCLPNDIHAMVPLPWTELGRANWLASFQAGAAVLTAQQLTRVSALCPSVSGALSAWSTVLSISFVHPGGTVGCISLKVQDSRLGCAALRVSQQPWNPSAWSVPVLLPASCQSLRTACCTA
jgi:hypothetical protein